MKSLRFYKIAKPKGCNLAKKEIKNRGYRDFVVGKHNQLSNPHGHQVPENFPVFPGSDGVTDFLLNHFVDCSRSEDRLVMEKIISLFPNMI